MVQNGDTPQGEMVKAIDGAGSSSATKGDSLDNSQGATSIDRVQAKLASIQLGSPGDSTGASVSHLAGHPRDESGAGDPPRTRGSTGADTIDSVDRKGSPFAPSHPGSDMTGAPLHKGLNDQSGHRDYAYAFPPAGMGIDVDAPSGALGGGQQSNISKYLNNNSGSNPGLDGDQLYGLTAGGVMDPKAKKAAPNDGATAGSAGVAGNTGRAPSGDNANVSRRYGVPMGSARNANIASRGAPAPMHGGVGFPNDDKRRGAGNGRRGGGINGGNMGVARSGRISGGVRTGYGGETNSPLRGAMDPSSLQVLPAGGYGSAGTGSMSPSSGTTTMNQGMYGSAGNGTAPGAMGPMGMQSPAGVGVHHGIGTANSVHAGGMGGAMGGHLGHMDPSQPAVMGQIPSGMYYGQQNAYGGGMSGQAAPSPALSHINTTNSPYPSSPGQGYGLQSGQQVGGIDMQQGMAGQLGGGYPVNGGMVPNMGVLPGGSALQSPYGYWGSGDVIGYGTNGVSNYGTGFGANGTDVSGRDWGSRGSNKNQPHQGSGQALHRDNDPYGPRGQPYDGNDYGRQGGYNLTTLGAGAAYGHFPYGPYGAVHDERAMNKRRGRGRSGSIPGPAGAWVGGSEHQRETELSLATANLSLEEVEGNVFRMSKDQIGCRLLQQKLDQGDPLFVQKICGEAQPHLPEMMKDPFGNYLFQKIAEKVDEAGRMDLLSRVADQLVDAGMNLHGTRSVQKVIEVCRHTPSQVAIIVNSLRDATVPLCMDTNGNHVVQRLLQNLAPNDNAFVYEILAGACVEVATHRHGCCVLQRAMDAATAEQSRLLVSHVCAHALPLMQDPFGNYVVQYVLSICTREEAEVLVNVPLGMVAKLSMQKFSSNVIEKCMDRASEDIIIKYVHELADPTAMRSLLQDQYANYVIQKTLQVAPRDAALKLVESIREHLPLMRNSSGGRRMLTKIAKRFPEIDLDGDVTTASGPGMPPNDA